MIWINLKEGIVYLLLVLMLIIWYFFNCLWSKFFFVIKWYFIVDLIDYGSEDIVIKDNMLDLFEILRGYYFMVGNYEKVLFYFFYFKCCVKFEMYLSFL